MAQFKDLQVAMQVQFASMSYTLFKTAVSKDILWYTYLNSFPPGTDPIYKQRTEHDCQCCKQFIQAMGSTVCIADNKLISIWDMQGLPEPYQSVANAMSMLVKAAPIKNTLLRYKKDVGMDHNFSLSEDGTTKRWDHFSLSLPRQAYRKNADTDTNQNLCKKCKSATALKKTLREL